MDDAMVAWGWATEEVTLLFPVRQMIARRMGFDTLNSLFAGSFASSIAEDEFKTGEHYLVRTFKNVILPLVRALRKGDQRLVLGFAPEARTSVLMAPIVAAASGK